MTTLTSFMRCIGETVAAPRVRRADVRTASPDSSPRLNHLLNSLSAGEFKCLGSHLEPVSMPLGQVICESGRKPGHVYFPTTAIVSLLSVLEDGSSTEVAAVGNEGLVGISLFLGGETTPTRAVVQSAGKAFRLEARLLRAEFNLAGSLQRLLLRYTQSLMTQVTQTAVCNRHHSLSQQLCRWLLTSLDRRPNDELLMTQESIATMLGVRRESVTEAAGKLQNAGVIEYRRGHIKVVDRPKLESMSCECYQVVRKENVRLAPPPTARRLWKESDERIGGSYATPARWSDRVIEGGALLSRA
jgi:CRP-like cAMP-binding protein